MFDPGDRLYFYGTGQTGFGYDLTLGGSPRAAIALLQTSKTLAALQGRDYIVPDDIKLLVAPVMRHRIILKPEAEIEGLNADRALERILARVEVPVRVGVGAQDVRQRHRVGMVALLP